MAASVTMTGLASTTRSANQKKQFKATTNSKHDLPLAPNLLEREFIVSQPDREYLGATTYILAGGLGKVRSAFCLAQGAKLLKNCW